MQRGIASRPCADGLFQNGRPSARPGSWRESRLLHDDGLGDQDVDALSKHLRFTVSENALGGLAPACDDAVQVLADNDIFRRLDNRSQVIRACGARACVIHYLKQSEPRLTHPARISQLDWEQIPMAVRIVPFSSNEKRWRCGFKSSG